MLPLLIGAAPFGLIYGVVASGTGLPPAAAQGMSLLVFAGAAQFIAVGLIGSGAPVAIVLLTTLVVNLRHVLYSASLAPHLRHLGWLWKWVLAFLMTDEAYALAISRYRQEAGTQVNTHWYFLGAALAIWATWQTSTAIGIVLGAQVPGSWGLDFTLALTFIGLLIPALTDRAAAAAALGAGVVAVVGADVPLRLGLVLAALAGIALGVCLDRRAPDAAARPPSPES